MHIHQKIRQIVRFDPKPQFQSVVILSYNRKNDRKEHKIEKEKAPDLGLFSGCGAHIGIRMVMKMVKSANYVNSLGLNNLTLVL